MENIFYLGRLRKKAYEMIRDGLIEEKDKVLIAFSGGPDSVFLYNLLNFFREDYSLELSLVYVNHNLREDVEEDIKFAKEFSEQNSVPLYIRSVDVKSYSRESRKSIELAARELRYNVINSLIEEIGYSKIATGHNLNDNVETFIFRLLRGTSLKGLKGIPVKRGRIIRPILQFEKKEILNCLQENGKRYIIDYTNNESGYTRNYIRNEVFPKFLRVNSDFMNKVNEIIAEINGSERRRKDVGETGYPSERMTKDDIAEYLKREGVEISRRKIGQIYRAFYLENGSVDESGSKEFYLGNNKILRKKYNKLDVILNDREKLQGKEIFQPNMEKRNEVIQGKEIDWMDYSIQYGSLTELIQNTFPAHGDPHGPTGYTFLKVDSSIKEYRLYLRKRKAGDVILLRNLGHKKVKKVLIDEKVSRWERDNIPILEMEYNKKGTVYNEIIGVGDIRFSHNVEKLNSESMEKIQAKEKIIVIGRKNER